MSGGTVPLVIATFIQSICYYSIFKPDSFMIVYIVTLASKIISLLCWLGVFGSMLGLMLGADLTILLFPVFLVIGDFLVAKISKTIFKHDYKINNMIAPVLIGNLTFVILLFIALNYALVLPGFEFLQIAHR